jgi:hypothetical protein
MAAIPWLPSGIRTWNLFAFGAFIPLLYFVIRWLWHLIHNQHNGDAPPLMRHQRQCGAQWWMRTLTSTSVGKWFAQHHQAVHITLTSMFLIFVALTVWLEFYYKEWCPISVVTTKSQLSLC